MNDTISIQTRYERALENRRYWESEWQNCFQFTIPQRNNGGSNSGAPLTIAPQISSKNSDIFDSTAITGSEQLANNIMAELMPVDGQWFEINAINAQNDAQYQQINEFIKEICLAANYQLELHQSMLDLVIAGTAAIAIEADEQYPFIKLSAIPIGQVIFEDNGDGQLNNCFRQNFLTQAQIIEKFPDFDISALRGKIDASYLVVEAILKNTDGLYDYIIFIPNTDNQANNEYCVLFQGEFEFSPIIGFRFMKSAGEIYGRSPIMRALPDIRTANKVVELILKNANIAVSGIWQADDDGVLNPANIQLKPGTIITKAVGSQGLTPLQSAGDFNLSQVILQDLRHNIQSALLLDKFSLPDNINMTATEILERQAQLTRILGASYGRLVAELMLPLIEAITKILVRLNQIPPQITDKSLTRIKISSPLQRRMQMMQAQSALELIKTMKLLGVDINPIITPENLNWLTNSFNLPIQFQNPTNTNQSTQ